MMVATNLFGILFLWASCSSYFSSILQQRQLFTLYLSVPVANAFTTLPTKHSLVLRGECHRTNNDDGTYSRSGPAWLQETPLTKQQYRQRRKGKIPTTLLRLQAIQERTQERTQERDVDVEEARVAAIPIQLSRFDKHWLQQFEKLKMFQAAHGHCNFPKNQRRLDEWVSMQRLAYNKNRIRADRKKLLDSIGFVWNLQKDLWQSQYNALKLYKIENGHCIVTRNEGKLGLWVNNQRIAFREDRLSEERINLLEEIGFSWDRLDTAWQKKYMKLMEFQQLYGHTNVAAEDPLSVWTVQQRLDHAAGRLTPNKKAMLDEFDFVWEDPDFERHEQQWLEMFSELEEYKRLNGHARVPITTSPLGEWVDTQRRLYCNDRLLDHRQEKLESIGFLWKLQEDRGREKRDTTIWDKKWMEMYEKLKEYQEEHGHSNVPSKADPLGTWASTQRSFFVKDTLREDRKKLLDEIGFEWGLKTATHDKSWQAQFEELQSFKNEFGHFKVPQSENMMLYQWIYRQRKLQRTGRLLSKRKEMLDQLGLEW